MNIFLARLGLALLRLTGDWSQGVRTFVAHAVADTIWFIAWPRRRVTMTNLRLCFPELSEGERRRMGRHVFRNIARAALDHAVLWQADAEQIDRYVQIEGAHHLTNPDNRPLIIVAPHFAGLDAGGARSSRLGRASFIYSRQKNPVWDNALLRARSRFGDPIRFQRQGLDMRKVVRTVKDGIPLYYLPDQDLGANTSIFVPFFGVPTATIPMVSRLARLAHAKVLMMVTEMTAQGYLVHVEAPWEHFPGASVEEDTARMNREIERWVRRLPTQYLWSHKRFKTRPPGEPSVY